MERGDRVLIEGLRVLGTHGVLPEETQRAQPFEVDLEIELPLEEAGRRDDLSATVDYGALSVQVAELVANERFELLEALALAIADAALAEAPVQAVTVRVRKLRPPVAADLASAAVVITRRRP